MRRGMTLVELVMGIVALAVVTGGALQLFVDAHAASVNAMYMQRAAAAGRALMSDVLSVDAWDEAATSLTGGQTRIATASATIGAEEADRDLFDDVDDFDGAVLDSATAWANASAVPADAWITGRIDVDFVDPASLQPRSNPTDVKRVRVTVEWMPIDDYPSSLTLTSYRSNL
jgi:prepilin-type N-terminal cleavage/methylation domain-containing protein